MPLSVTTATNIPTTKAAAPTPTATDASRRCPTVPLGHASRHDRHEDRRRREQPRVPGDRDARQGEREGAEETRDAVRALLGGSCAHVNWTVALTRGPAWRGRG